jgi:hypothetical protein
MMVAPRLNVSVGGWKGPFQKSSDAEVPPALWTNIVKIESSVGAE